MVETISCFVNQGAMSPLYSTGGFMYPSFTEQAGKAAVCLAAVAAIVAGAPAEASASTREQHFWDDCGPVHCTRYYSVEKSVELFEGTQSWGWSVMRTLSDLSALSAAVAHKDQVGQDGFESSVNDAVHYGGCLQFQWRQDGVGNGRWDYTTHSGYCFEETYVDSDGNVWNYDSESNTYSTGF
ncbi:hypothetical protein [Rhodococcus sp. IEGM 1341]|uniref:hypothetical protein n=2 Tax=unclassified Rhodococcus (in: high G+C Gram-positive bacteria) TaxID=192944 RepID=UPI0024B6647C|nr:hypothetical protein [Rhodococcus sp. IEGM 1341]MDI9928679.1 hypothetical protein [Rhodococcus sp. IEGM 1341]